VWRRLRLPCRHTHPSAGVDCEHTTCSLFIHSLLAGASGCGVAGRRQGSCWATRAPCCAWHVPDLSVPCNQCGIHSGVLYVSACRSIRLWRGGSAAGQLLGHEGPVLCLAVTEEGDLLSGSGDHTIRRWAGSSCTAVYKGHTDTVRWAAGVQCCHVWIWHCASASAHSNSFEK
jgi:WD40 repeat protein